LYTDAQVYDSKPDGDSSKHAYKLHILSSNQPSTASGSTGCPIDPSMTSSPSGGLGALAATSGQENYFEFEISDSHIIMASA
jgi:hypothetical protein